MPDEAVDSGISGVSAVIRKNTLTWADPGKETAVRSLPSWGAPPVMGSVSPNLDPAATHQGSAPIEENGAE